MHPALRQTLTDILTVASYAAQDSYGKPSHGAAVARKGRIEHSTWAITTQTGQEAVSHTRVFFDGADGTLTDRARITFPDGTHPPIQRLNTMTDEVGHLDHYLAYF